MMKPLVSIVIPVYNGSNYLAEAIDSALAQTYDNIEIIVINDGSKDDGATERVALSYGDKIRYIAKGNGGVSSALNRGIREMKGEYFSWLSHDDIYKPEKIAKQVSLIENENDIVLCSGSQMLEDRTPIKYPVKTLDKTLDGISIFNEVLHGYSLNGLGFLVPKRVFDMVGLFDEDMRYLQDFDMWVRMMWYGFRFVCHSDKLVVSRIHKAQQTNVIPDQYFVDREYMADKHLEAIKKLDEKTTEIFLQTYICFFAFQKNKKAFAKAKTLCLQRGEYVLKTRKSCLVYYIRGSVKSWLKLVKAMLYKIINVRD